MFPFVSFASKSPPIAMWRPTELIKTKNDIYFQSCQLMFLTVCRVISYTGNLNSY